MVHYFNSLIYANKLWQIKLALVKLAMKYMRRVSSELEAIGGGGPEEEELIVQGVRFAFRVHQVTAILINFYNLNRDGIVKANHFSFVYGQFAGGFDVETMRAFEDLRDKARSCTVQCQNQQNFICRSTTPSWIFKRKYQFFCCKDRNNMFVNTTSQLLFIHLHSIHLMPAIEAGNLLYHLNPAVLL